MTPEHIDYFLHPQFDPADRRAARGRGDLIATGLNVSPGAASGALVFDADTAEAWAIKDRKAVIMVRAETRPDDVHGMLAANGILTSRGGRTSHAALVARQFGKPAVVGASTLDVDAERRVLSVGGREFREGDIVSIDGTTGEVFAGALSTVVPDFNDPYLLELLRWADGFRTLAVWANADYPRDAERARGYGAEGIGLARTEHMFFETSRLPLVQRMILAQDDAERDAMLALLLPIQRDDFVGLFRAMDGLPVTIRLIDPPLHEFLPSHDDLLRDVTVLETRQQIAGAELATGADPLGLAGTLAQKQRLLAAVESMREANPMLGLRGVRLGLHLPSLVRMQVRAIVEAACLCAQEGIRVKPKIMIPLTAHSNELKVERAILEDEARTVMKERGRRVRYQFGHDDRGAARGADRGRPCARRRVLLVRHQRPDADDVRHLARRRRDRLPARVPGEGHPAREPVRDARPGRRRSADGDGRGGRAPDAAAARGRHLRRARRRSEDDRLLPPHRSRLRQLFAVPRADRAAGSRARRADGGGVAPARLGGTPMRLSPPRRTPRESSQSARRRSRRASTGARCTGTCRRAAVPSAAATRAAPWR